MGREVVGIWVTEQRCSFALLDLPKQAAVGQRPRHGGGQSKVQSRAGMKGYSARSLESSMSAAAPYLTVP